MKWLSNAVLIMSVSVNTMSTVQYTNEPTLSTGAIVGIVIGLIVVTIVVIATVALVRLHFGRCSQQRKSVSNEFTVSYTRSNLDVSDTSVNNSNSSILIEHNVKCLGLVSKMDSELAIENPISPLGEEVEREMAAKRDDHLIENRDVILSGSSEHGIENPCFVLDNDRATMAEIARTSSLSNKNTLISVNQTNFHSERHSDSDQNINDFNQKQHQRGNAIRRSYHLDRTMASVIATQKNQETTAIPELCKEFNSGINEDMIIVFRARTAL